MTTSSSKKGGRDGNISKEERRRREAAEKAARAQLRRSISEQQDAAIRSQKDVDERTAQWADKVLPRWDTMRNSKKVTKLCSRGAPPMQCPMSL
jgi:hypothetical protein